MPPAQPRHPGEVGFTLLLIAATLVVGREAWRISGFSGPSSPGFAPLALVAVILAGLLIELARALAHRPAEREPLSVRIRRLRTALAPPAVAGAVPLLVLYLVGLEQLGFVTASFLFLVAATGLLLRGRLLLVLAVAAGTVAVVRLVFQEVFQVLLP